MVTGAQFLAAAMKYKGVPYFEGNPQTATALDCSGLVQRTASDLGMHISRTTFTQFADAASHVGPGKLIGADLGQAQQGDVIYYVGHCEIWVGGGKVFSEATDGTVADTRNRTPWSIQGIVRYADGGPGDTGGNSALDTAKDWLDPFGVVHHTAGGGGISDGISSGIDSVTGSVKSLVSFTQAISDFFGAINKPGFWVRAGAAILGAMALMMGFYGVTKSEMNLSSMAKGATTTVKGVRHAG